MHLEEQCPYLEQCVLAPRPSCRLSHDNISNSRHIRPGLCSVCHGLLTSTVHHVRSFSESQSCILEPRGRTMFKQATMISSLSLRLSSSSATALSPAKIDADVSLLLTFVTGQTLSIIIVLYDHIIPVTLNDIPTVVASAESTVGLVDQRILHNDIGSFLRAVEVTSRVLFSQIMCSDLLSKFHPQHFHRLYLVPDSLRSLRIDVTPWMVFPRRADCRWVENR